MNDTKQKMKLYYDSYEKDFGDGFYPSTTKSEPCTTEIDITFVLTPSIITDGVWSEPELKETLGVGERPNSAYVVEGNEGVQSNHYWIQTNCTNINGLDGDEGYKLLTLLNESMPETRCNINGMNSGDVQRISKEFEGIGIVNSLGKILYPKKCA